MATRLRRGRAARRPRRRGARRPRRAAPSASRRRARARGDARRRPRRPPVFLLAERAVDGPPRYRPATSPRRPGAARAARALRRAQGLPVPDPDAVALTDPDVEAIRTARAFREAGVPDEQMLAVVRVLGRGMAQAAESCGRRARARPRARIERGRARAALRRAQRRLGADARPDAQQMLRLHLRHAVGTEALSAAERRRRHAARRARGLGRASRTSSASRGWARMSRRPSSRARRAARRAGRRPARRRAAGEDDRRRRDARPHRRRRSSTSRSTSTTPPRARATTSRSCGSASRSARRSPRGRLVRAAGEPRGPDDRVARPGTVLATREVRDAARDGYRWSAAGGGRCAGSRGPWRCTARGAAPTEGAANTVAARHARTLRRPPAAAVRPVAGSMRRGRGRRHRRRGRAGGGRGGGASQASAAAIPTALIAISVVLQAAARRSARRPPSRAA